MEEGGRGHGRLLVLRLGHVSSGIREMIGKVSIPSHVGTVLYVQPMQLPDQVLQLPVLILMRAVLKVYGFGFNLLRGAVWCFIFRVEVV